MAAADGFIGRSRELSRLNELYEMPRSNTCAVFGRRIIGKTTLLHRFCEGKPSLFVTAPGISPELTWNALSRKLSRSLGREVRIDDTYDLIDAFCSLDNDRKTAIVLDEFPLLAEVDPSAPPVLKEFIDHEMKEHDLMLILCGSSMRAMGEHLNDGDAPLFRRFPVQIRLDPLTYPESRGFHPGLTEEDMIRMYSVCSGIPAYHEYMSGMSVRNGISSGFMEEPALLRTEAENVMSMELKPKDAYGSILAAMRDGEAKVTSMMNVTGYSRQTCLNAMENLVTLGTVRKEICYGKTNKQKFVLTDGFIDFNYEVIAGTEPYNRFTRDEDTFDTFQDRIASFFDHRFEEVCRQYVSGTEKCRWIGKWWGSVPRLEDGAIVRDESGKAVTDDTDIDIVAEAMNGVNVDLILCECKFTRRKTGMRELEELVNRGMSVRKGHQNKRYILFSRSGFTDDLIEYLEDHPGLRAKLVGMDDIRKWAESASDNRIRYQT